MDNSPSLHILKLHEDAAPGGNYERFGFQWILDETDAESIVSEGDVVFIPSLLTGGGEFEGLRFVGKRQPTNPKNFVLHNGGIEYPEFPKDIIAMTQSLQAAYAPLLDKMLVKTMSGPDSLEEVMEGADGGVAEFWANPPKLREKECGDTWVIPLRDCTIEDTMGG
jgi:hypothetical protein